jgi:hypothetical protein
VLARYNYDSFGNALNFDPSSALTTHLLADGVYNSSNGFEYQRARWRSNFEFTQRDDDGYGNNSDPVSLHRYLYAGADPIDNIDPSGHDFIGTLVAVGITSVLSGIVGAAFGGIEHGVKGAIGGFVGSFAGTAVSLTLLAPLTAILGPFGIGISFGVGGAIQTIIEKLFVDGEEALHESSTWIEVGEAFVFSAGLGAIGAAETTVIKNEISGTVARMKSVWNLLGKIQNGTTEVIERDIAESGLTQDLQTMMKKYAPRFKSLALDLLKGNLKDELTIRALIQQAIQPYFLDSD